MASRLKLIPIVVLLTLPAIVCGAELAVLDDGTGLDNLTVAPGPVSGLQLQVKVANLGTDRVTGLTDGIEVGSADAGRFEIDSYAYNSPYSGVPFTPMVTDLGTDHAGSCQDNDPSGVMNSATGGNTAGGVGFWASNWDPFDPPGPIANPFADVELIGVLTISSVTDVSDGESFTFTLNGDLILNDSSYLEPPTSNAFTLNVEAGGAAPVIVRAQSHKLHPGLYGFPDVDYGVDMTTSCATTGVEGRANGPTRLQFEFDVDVDISGASVVLSTGALDGGTPYTQPSSKILEVAVTGLFRQQPLPGTWVQVDISGVTAGGIPMLAATHWIKSMYGDINNDAWADGSDIVAAKTAGMGITGNGANPRVDLNVDGWTDGSDIVEAKLSTVSTVWPACP